MPPPRPRARSEAEQFCADSTAWRAGCQLQARRGAKSDGGDGEHRRRVGTNLSNFFNRRSLYTDRSVVDMSVNPLYTNNPGQDNHPGPDDAAAACGTTPPPLPPTGPPRLVVAQVCRDSVMCMRLCAA